MYGRARDEVTEELTHVMVYTTCVKENNFVDYKYSKSYKLRYNKAVIVCYSKIKLTKNSNLQNSSFSTVTQCDA